jgi:hypothetical protein
MALLPHPDDHSYPMRSAWTTGSNSSHGVFQRSPSIEMMAARPLPDGCPSFGPGLPPPCSFRPCRSSRLRRFAPRDPRRSVAPCTRSWGSVRFGPRRCAHLSVRRDAHPSPEPRITPFRAFSLVRSRTASPRPLPSRHPSGATPTPKCDRALADLRALLCRRVRYRGPALPPGSDPMLSWASFPSRVLPEFSSTPLAVRRGSSDLPWALAHPARAGAAALRRPTRGIRWLLP